MSGRGETHPTVAPRAPFTGPNAAEASARDVGRAASPVRYAMMLLRPTKPSARPSRRAEYASSTASNVSWRTISSCASVSRRKPARHDTAPAPPAPPAATSRRFGTRDRQGAPRCSPRRAALRQRVGGHAPRAASTASVVGAQARPPRAPGWPTEDGLGNVARVHRRIAALVKNRAQAAASATVPSRSSAAVLIQDGDGVEVQLRTSRSDACLEAGVLAAERSASERFTARYARASVGPRPA